VLDFWTDSVRLVPGAGYLLKKYQAGLDWLIPWVGTHILRHPVPIAHFNGSGDRTSDYVEVFTYLLIATLSTIVWSLLDRKRANYRRLHQWLRLGVRVVLGHALLTYGAMKVVADQMAVPSPSVLLETYGESSPMGLLWTLLGASTAYQIFCGASEMLGGILLFIPALTTLGALVSIGVLTNVFMLNMCYDVPVKIYSFHLLLMAIFLLLPDLKRLFNLFVLRRTIKLSDDTRLFQRKWLNHSVWALQVLLGLFLACTATHYFYQEKKEYTAKPPYYGVWSVEEYAVDGTPKPPLLTDATRWRRVIFDYPGRVGVQLMDAPQQRFILALDADKKSFTLSKRGDDKWKANFSYQDPDRDRLELQGQFDGHQVHARLHREEESKFLLTSRGFHWINEAPFRR
jgi:uncharacterized membrane protein YphA (DoxX/SURF4 family)